MSSVITENQRYIVREWTHRGIECAILVHPRYGHMNGYVRVPDPSKVEEDVPFDVHGRITYGPDEERWIGFDTAHAGDLWPDLPDPLGLYSTEEPYRNEWTIERLEAEVNRLAEQVAAL